MVGDSCCIHTWAKTFHTAGVQGSEKRFWTFKAKSAVCVDLTQSYCWLFFFFVLLRSICKYAVANIIVTADTRNMKCVIRKKILGTLTRRCNVNVQKQHHGAKSIYLSTNSCNVLTITIVDSYSGKRGLRIWIYRHVRSSVIVICLSFNYNNNCDAKKKKNCLHCKYYRCCGAVSSSAPLYIMYSVLCFIYSNADSHCSHRYFFLIS